MRSWKRAGGWLSPTPQMVPPLPSLAGCGVGQESRELLPTGPCLCFASELANPEGRQAVECWLPTPVLLIFQHSLGGPVWDLASWGGGP